MEEKFPELDLHSEEIQDIIYAVPHWTLRSGAGALLALLAVIISLAAVIEYPDIVSARVTITSTNFPKPVVAKLTGKLLRILVKNGTSVSIDEPLAYLESTADPDSIIKFKQYLIVTKRSLQNGTFFGRYRNIQEPVFRLGEIQPAFENYYQEYLNFMEASDNGLIFHKKKYLFSDIANVEQRIIRMKQQKVLLSRDSSLAEQDYRMHQKLFNQRVETSAELRGQESKFLAKKVAVIQLEDALIAEQTALTAKQKEVTEIDNTIKEAQGRFSQSLNSLESTVDTWISKYVMIAPISGKVLFGKIIEENDLIKAGDQAFVVSPINQAIFAEIFLSQNNLGKVKVGQAVRLKLQGYPFQEFGVVKGKVSEIGQIPYDDSLYISKVEILKYRPKKNNALQLKLGMTGKAEIVTKQTSILRRIINSALQLNR